MRTFTATIALTMACIAAPQGAPAADGPVKVVYHVNQNKIDPKKVIPEASLVPSGVAEVSRLQFKEAFAYLRP